MPQKMVEKTLEKQNEECRYVTMTMMYQGPQLILQLRPKAESAAEAGARAKLMLMRRFILNVEC